MVGGLRARAARWRDDDVFLVAATVIAVALSLWLIRDLWGEGIPIGSDAGAHFTRAEVALEQFFARGRLDGWQARFGVGYQQSLFLGPGFNLAVGAVKVLSLGSLSTVDCVKAVMTLAYATAPVAVAVLARGFGLGRRAAGVAALLSLGVTSTMGGAGLAGMFMWSLSPHALGALFTLLALAGSVSILRLPTARRIVATAAAVAAVLYTHPWTGLVLVVFLVCVLATLALEQVLYGRLSRRHPDDPAPHLLDRRGLTQRVLALGVAATVGGLLAAAQLVPTLVHRGLKGDNSPFPDPPVIERWREALAGTDHLRPYVLLLVLAGMAYLVTRVLARRPFALVLLATPLLYLGVARGLRNVARDNLLAIQLMNRSLWLIGFVGILGAAWLLGDLGRIGATLARRDRGSRAAAPAGLRLAGGAALIVALVALITVPRHPPREVAINATPTPALAEAAAELRRRVPDTGRYAVQRSPRDGEISGVWFPEFWVNWASGRNALNYYNLESSYARLPLDEFGVLDSHPPDEKADRLRRGGVTHLLLFQPELLPALVASPRFPTVWSRDGITIVEVVDRDGRRPDVLPLVTAGAPVMGTATSADPQDLALEVTSERAQPVTLAIGYSPKWRLTVDGREVPTTMTTDRLLTVDVPEGTSRITAVYRPDTADAVGQLVTVVTAAGLGITAVGARRRRRDDRRPSDRRRRLIVDAPTEPAARDELPIG